MNKDIKIESMEDALKVATGFKPGELVPVPTSSLTRECKSRSISIKLRSEYGTEESVIKNVFLPVVKLETMAKNYLNSVNLKNENRMFKSGFAWMKINGYSYICKIIERNEDDTLFTVELDDCTFTDVPVTALAPLRGDE